MSGIDADNELFAPIAGKLHLKLVAVIYLSSRLPCFPHNLLVEPFTDPDGPLAHSCMCLGGFNRQEIGEYLGCLPLGHHTSQTGCQFHQLRRRSIGTDFLQRGEGAVHTRMAIPAQHLARIADLNGAEDGSDPA